MRERVRTTPASVLDSALPPLAFDDWLFATLAPLMDVPWQPPSAWRVRFCDDREFPIPEGGRELCVDASVRVTADKAVHIIVAADEPAVGSDDRVRWRSIRLNVRDVGVGQSIRLEFDALLQAGRATAVVTVEPAASTKVIRESQPRKDPAFMIVSVPTWRRQ